MANYSYLIEITIIFLTASVIGLVLSRLKIPTLFSYILTGVILGPSATGVINDPHMVNELAEIGVIALLFTLGLEFSFEKFIEVGKNGIIAGIAQISLTIAITAIITFLFGLNFVQSFFLGSIVVLSSTVIVLKSLSELDQTDTLHGRLMLAILIIQDLSLIPIMIIVTNISKASDHFWSDIFFSLVLAAIYIIISIFLSIKLAPKLMNEVVSSNRESLIIFSIGIAIGTALLSTLFGISLALGAFIAGLSLSITVQSRQVAAEVIPFRDVFAMIFFVSIGILMDMNYFLHNIFFVFAVVVGIFALKFLICFAIIYFLKYPGRSALWVGLSLFQIGEFSFVLAQIGESSSIISKDTYSLIIISSLITMILTPFVVKLVPTILDKINSTLIWNKYFKGKSFSDTQDAQLSNHTIIAGFGPIGKCFANVLRLNKEKYVVVELNANTVQNLIQKGESVIYGDFTNYEILKHAGIESAKLVLISFPDIASSELAIKSIRDHNTMVKIIARSRFKSGIDVLYKAGADKVIFEEFEGAVAVVNSALDLLGYSREKNKAVLKLLRENVYSIIRSAYENNDIFSEANISLDINHEIELLKIEHLNPIINSSLEEISQITNSSLNIISIIKAGKSFLNPPKDTIIEENDILVILGSKSSLIDLKNKVVLAE